MEIQALLETITDLSHEFGGTDYVKGGGGNTSVKTAETLYVKPSGVTLAGLAPDKFVAMNRQKLGELFSAEAPSEASAREELVKNMMAAAVLPGFTGRPSVEAPLHDTFRATYVVHTHPAVVNGMTCARNGESVCRQLFPKALWVDYIDPGYTLCMAVRKTIQEYEKQHGHEPNIVFLKNHGVFIAGNTPDEVRATYKTVLDTLHAEYQKAGIALTFPISSAPADTASVKQLLSAAGGADVAAVEASGFFKVAADAITPDHIVYAKSFPWKGEISAASFQAYKAERGYAPRVYAGDTAVYGLGSTAKVAALALEFAQDGALVEQLAQAFGGIQYLDDSSRLFIENWEVESYRQKVMETASAK
ncbi:TPA: hypothetical protein DDW35_04725 [Candidatus Sumerlaeota bacterium]|jgi:rhamnose utilization protein RhaD (predicted bifunctional aldolase and dehydrogenase)|nr:hypothetical protein [Candidatus Sumerlaeota bacterium]